MKALLIKQCNDHLMWYSKLVGHLVPFMFSDAQGYWSKEPAGYTNIVKHAHAEIVDVPDGTPMYCKWQPPLTARDVVTPMLEKLKQRLGL